MDNSILLSNYLGICTVSKGQSIAKISQRTLIYRNTLYSHYHTEISVSLSQPNSKNFIFIFDKNALIKKTTPQVWSNYNRIEIFLI